MRFKDSVLSDIETKHLNMFNGRTPTPFSFDASFVSRGAYSAARDNYQRRLNSEMQQYNSALETVKRRRRERLIDEGNLKAAKKRDRKIYAPCLIVFLVAIVGLFLIIHFAMRNGIAYWVKDVIVEETSFKSFFALFSHYRDNTGFEVGITAMALAVALWLGLLIFAIVKRVRDYECGWLIGLLLGGLIISGAPIMLPFLAIRLLFVGLGYVVYFLLTPYGLIVLGGIAVILIIILGRRIRLKRFKALLAFTIIFSLAFTGGFWYFSNDINDEGHEYYDAHNGMSFETAKELFVGKNSYALLYEGNNDAFYFIISPQESGEYEISSDSGENIELYFFSEDKKLIMSDTDSTLSITQSLENDKKYYLVVKYKLGYGHFKVVCEKS